MRFIFMRGGLNPILDKRISLLVSFVRDTWDLFKIFFSKTNNVTIYLFSNVQRLLLKMAWNW